jgi:hypothetical protein
MHLEKGRKFQSMLELWEYLPRDEREIVDVLRQIILEHLPSTCREKLAYNIPVYYGRKRICMIWPASVPCGGVKKGVLLGFSQGYKLKDPDNYLTHGTNKRVFYKIFYRADEIQEPSVVSLLKEAIRIDGQ